MIDCDTDEDCEFGLACFQRDGVAEVPGCRGSGIDGKDYCYKPEPGQLVFMGTNLAPRENFPLEAFKKASPGFVVRRIFSPLKRTRI